ncbi:MAG: BlaI/MecI/CopY family transcriptional regulator [Gemmatimonadota bacterium]
MTIGFFGSTLLPVPPKRHKAIPRLGELERAALDYLWRAGDADVAETHAALGARRGITLNTIGSALERLHRKGLASRWKVSHAYRYKAAIAADAFRARQVIDAAGGVRALAGRGLLAAFVDLVADTDEAALDQLEQLIAEKRGETEA